jgi:polyisoprenoid-binding protein YceI
MKKILILMFFVLTVGIVTATKWTPTTASVVFYIKNAGITVDGSLAGLKASVKFDPKSLDNSKIYASVDVNTIKTGIEQRDKHLKEATYFNAAKYPEITMESSSFSKDGSQYIGNFDVTIKGKVKTIRVPFTFTENNGKGTFNGRFNLNRLDFGVGKSSFILDDDVLVKITLNTTKN